MHPKFQILAATATVILALFFEVSATEWGFLLYAIASVLISEVFNSVIENVMDLLHPEQHPQVGKIKDMAAGGVLIAAVIAFIVGSIIFIPKILTLIQKF